MKLSNFFREESGAVTVDWVVLTAAICGIAIVSFASIQSGSKSVGDRVGVYLSTTDIEDLH
ncbi:hypothetical protein [Sulfitobacter sp. S190]|uniref:hypothetical protein n=1 Tax=Sulfitobacter sp. S190 TaxID=2867022 RepID=UPI0021A60BC6|nr:hypothetical protein [Sulfitobacter sp. S190]UWR23402.1 hypothetical protein K3756_05295 [Sulfitobacter sp. S190]